VSTEYSLGVALMHRLELKGVSSGYNGHRVLHDISLDIREPSIYVVLGPNGAGKTTLFRTIGGILEPYSGEVSFDGENVFVSKETRKRMNYLSHYNAIPEEMTVYNALKFYSDIEGGNANEVLNLLSLKELRDKKISDLSQGQKSESQSPRYFSAKGISTYSTNPLRIWILQSPRRSETSCSN